MVESSEKLLHALLITQISKEDYTDLEISGLFQKSAKLYLPQLFHTYLI